jgi:hypothetical protein
LEDLPDIVAAGDDPAIEVGAVEDRGSRPRLGEEGVRIDKVWIMNWTKRSAKRGASLNPVPLISAPFLIGVRRNAWVISSGTSRNQRRLTPPFVSRWKTLLAV